MHALPDVATLARLFLVAGVAGFIDSIAGGGGLLCVPALLAAGLSPAQTLATNKLQASFGTLSASLHFLRAGQAALRPLLPAIATAFVGAAAGTLTVQAIDPGFMRRILPPLLMAVAAYVLFSPRIGDEDRQQRLPTAAFTFGIAPALGFYDGFFGPGTGSFLTVALVALMGVNLRRATAETKVLNLTSNLASLLFFLLGGQVVWKVGLVMAIGQFAGARLGAHVVVTRGTAIIRPCLVAVSLAMTIRLAVGDGSGWLGQQARLLWLWLSPHS